MILGNLSSFWNHLANDGKCGWWQCMASTPDYQTIHKYARSQLNSKNKVLGINQETARGSWIGEQNHGEAPPLYAWIRLSSFQHYKFNFLVSSFILRVSFLSISHPLLSVWLEISKAPRLHVATTEVKFVFFSVGKNPTTAKHHLPGRSHRAKLRRKDPQPSLARRLVVEWKNQSILLRPVSCQEAFAGRKLLPVVMILNRTVFFKLALCRPYSRSGQRD